MLSEKHPCERFTTKSGEHAVSAHRDVICVEPKWTALPGGSVCYSQLYMPLAEARELVRVLLLAIDETAGYQATLGVATTPVDANGGKDEG